MPIKQIQSQHDLSMDHGNWLTSKFKNVQHKVLELKFIKNFVEVSMNLITSMDLKFMGWIEWQHRIRCSSKFWNCCWNW